jgi:hypothetical protein
VRIKITRARKGEIDGVNLCEFIAGITYDVHPSLATYLIATASAEPVTSDELAFVTPTGEAQLLSTIAGRVRAVVDRVGPRQTDGLPAVSRQGQPAGR